MKKEIFNRGKYKYTTLTEKEQKFLQLPPICNKIYYKFDEKLNLYLSKNKISNKFLKPSLSGKKFKLNLPVKFTNTFKQDTENLINIEYVDDCIKLSKIYEDKKRSNKPCTVYTVKINKGGVGKTFITLQLAHGLALSGYRVLVLTSDSQNNILDYSMPDTENNFDISKGLQKMVISGHNNNIITIRNDLDFIPTESSVFSKTFVDRFHKFIEEMRLKYDYILIDSIPTMEVDKTFMKETDKVIIPMVYDTVTLKGAINVIEESGFDKVHSVIGNMYQTNSKFQKGIRQDIESVISNTEIIVPKPIPKAVAIQEMLDQGKTIFEIHNKKIKQIQKQILEVVSNM